MISLPKKNIFLLLFFCLPLLVGCDSKKTIVNALDEKEANEIIVYLSLRGIDATKVKNNDAAGGGGQPVLLWDISVPAERSTEAMSILNRAGLPRRRGQSLLGIFKNTGLVPTDLQEKIKYQAGLGEQIGSTIRKIDGVIDADVQISFPEEDPLNPGQTKDDITASIYIKHTGVIDDPNTHLATKIKRLVTASVPALQYENVTLVLDRARFSDTPTSALLARTEQDKQYVTTWSLVIAKESLTRFRIIFFAMGSILILILLMFVWLFWKLWPLLTNHGGFKGLFSLHPIAHIDEKKEEEEGDATAQPEEQEELEEENPFVETEAPGDPSDVEIDDEGEEPRSPAP